MLKQFLYIKGRYFIRGETVQQILVRIGIIVMGLLYIFLIPSDPTVVKLIFKVIPIALIIYYACLVLRRITFHDALFKTACTLP